jgi:hypothetical protein
LNVFEKGGFSQLVADAVKAAYERAKELGATSAQAGSQEITPES